jgi:hypothetical protein
MAMRTAYDYQYSHSEWASISAETKREILESVLDTVAMHPVAALLMEMAEADGVSIMFDRSMIGGATDGVIDILDKTVFICPLRDREQLCNTVLHELRHYWQMKQVGLHIDNDAIDCRDVTMLVLINRVMEAEADAFADLMMRDLSAIMKAKDAGMPMSEKLLMDDPRNMGQAFIDRLKNLDAGYDENMVEAYHALYLPRFGKAETKELPEGETFIDIPRLRCILKSGVTADAPAYMAGMPDETFERIIKKSISPTVARPIRLIDAFEKAAAKMSAKESRHARMKIGKIIKALDR